MALHIGTSGWSYPAWKPGFFPNKLPQKRFLEYYATQLNAVELNLTFRRFATASSQQGWIEASPPDFKFAAKIHQTITHFRRLKDCAEPMRSFLQSLDLMREAGRLGPILIQTPPNLKADLALITDFAHLLPRAYQFAFEFRHDSWFNDGVYEVLKSRNAALCWAESEKIEAPRVATADFLYYRFRQPEYSKEQIKELAHEFMRHSHKRDVFAFFKHEDTPEGALNAVAIARMAGIEAKPFAMPEAKSKIHHGGTEPRRKAGKKI
jgi:uncharacterized protein YecE (DUF72 family)